MKRIAVIGAGPAGLIASAFASTDETTVEVFDRNEKAGKKLFLTGKGRCNITNDAGRDDFMRNIPRNPRFLYSAFDGFFNYDIIDLIESQGVPTKVEGRLGPSSSSCASSEAPGSSSASAFGSPGVSDSFGASPSSS